MSLSKCCSFFAVLAITVICTFGLVVFNTLERAAALDRLDQNTQIDLTRHADTAVVHLYFSDKENSYLTAEEQNLVHSNNPAEFGQTIIEALIQGPREGLMRTIPAGTILRALYVTSDGIAYVDLTLKDAHPGGIQTELMTIYSIVNSLILNISGINAVKILIDGRESMTLAGHVDLRFPFKANMLLIR
ncbi:MAG: GerMN domain-containing protein [Desulfobacterales bacterium]|uniref:GerMN domain-containing protein n=1 Tax=Candidatus Desulfatibia profunda TaxID=2841695 RepID=A0A8J6TH29_9BACT|nr:GerMN domain-containing protein [Candidatus Desulfatibia profunda]MBL7178636.1 GerMN domain-containing protein [Desulfobacterales bacterium]